MSFLRENYVCFVYHPHSSLGEAQRGDLLGSS
jgi:hypothetical protein